MPAVRAGFGARGAQRQAPCCAATSEKEGKLFQSGFRVIAIRSSITPSYKSRVLFRTGSERPSWLGPLRTAL